MIDITRLNSWIDFCLALGALLALLVGWVKVVRPRWRKGWRKAAGGWYSIVGREAIIDPRTEQEIAPALPGIGVWMDTQEKLTAENTKQMAELTETVATLAKVVEHQSRLDNIVEDHEKRVTALEAARVEQMLARQEATAAYRAIEAAQKGAADTVLDDALDPRIQE